jgi:hypothetical protein
MAPLPRDITYNKFTALRIPHPLPRRGPAYPQRLPGKRTDRVTWVLSSPFRNRQTCITLIRRINAHTGQSAATRSRQRPNGRARSTSDQTSDGRTRSRPHQRAPCNCLLARVIHTTGQEQTRQNNCPAPQESFPFLCVHRNSI